MSVIVENSTIVLSGTVGAIYWDEPGFTAAEVSMALAQVGHDTDVLIRLNSDGGYASEGAAIHAALDRHGGKVTIAIEGIAASSASLLAMAGDEIVMAPGSILMIHDPATVTWGTAADHETSLRYLTALATSFAGIYAARSGRTLEAARADMAAEVWFAPDEAVAAGYADRVGNDPAAGSEAEVIEFPERDPDPVAYAMLRHQPEMFRNAPEPLKALAVAKGWAMSPRPSQAAPAVVPNRQETTMTTAPGGGGAPTPPAPQSTTTTQPVTAGPATNVVELDAARSTARTEALAYARGVNELCQLAGHPERATAFIEKETSLEDVRKSLVDIKAQATATSNITNQQAPSKGRFSLAGNMRGRYGQKEA